MRDKNRPGPRRPVKPGAARPGGSSQRTRDEREARPPRVARAWERRDDEARPAERKPRFGDSPRTGDKPRTDKPRYGDTPRYEDGPRGSDKPRYADKPRHGDKPRAGAKPRTGDTPRYGDPPRSSDRPRTGGKPRHGDRPRTGDKSPAREKPRAGEKPRRSGFGGRGAAPERRDRAARFDAPRRRGTPVPPPPRVTPQDRPEWDEPLVDIDAGDEFETATASAPSAHDAQRDPLEGLALGYHAVRTALETQPKRVERLLLARGQRDHRTQHLVRLAEEHHVPFQQTPREALDRLAAGLQHQGVIAKLAGAELLTEDELLARLPENALVMVLDGVQDPRNLGAILRSAAALGAHGVFLPGHRSAGLSPAAVRTAAGAVELVPIARAGNVSLLLETLEAAGLTPVALDVRGAVPPWEADLRGGIALVAGGEEKGIRPSVLERCPVRVRIPVASEVGSLNVSVAVGVVLAEATRQRRTGD